MVKKKESCGVWLFLCGLPVIFFFLYFINILGFSFLFWHLFVHIGIILFCVLILFKSFKFSKKIKWYLFLGSILSIGIQFLLVFCHVFEEYIWMETNLFVFLGVIGSFFLLMFGFREVVK